MPTPVARTLSPCSLTLSVLLGLLLWTSPAQAAHCKIACKGGACSVTSTDSRQAPPQAAEGRWTTVPNCDQLQVVAGVLELRYLHRGRWFMPAPQQATIALKDVFKKNPADTCSVVTPVCLQQNLDAKQAAVGGHGIDNRMSKPGGEGNPCARGLPCGSVLPRADTIMLRLLDGNAQGQLQVRAARGQTAEFQAPIQNGRASLSGASLQPGGLYVYQFIDAAGKTVASGEFSMLSAAMTERLRQRAAQRQEQQGLSAAQAWYDTLLENQLLWDALQLDLESDNS